MIKMTAKRLLLAAGLLLLGGHTALAASLPADYTNGTVVDENYDPYHIEQELAANMAEQQLNYAPKVTTLENGVQIQRTPSDDGIYNTYVLKADSRGCAACHNNLRETLNNLPMGHMDLHFAGDIDVTVEHCIGCHTYSPGYVPEEYSFGSLVHGLHKTDTFTQVGGSCMSCHDANEGSGQMTLWDQTKYDAMRGILPVAEDAIEAEFSFDQTTMTPDEDSYSLNWLDGWTDYMVYDDYVNGLQTEHQTLLDWEITVDGLVDEPYTMKMSEILEEFEPVTKVLTMHCTLDPPGGGCISTWEVTGIPIMDLVNKAGIQEGATGVYTVPTDEVCAYPATMEHLAKYDALIVYQINGHDLRYYQGFPVMSWVTGMGAPNYAKQLCELLVTDEPVDEMYLYQGWVREEEGRFFNKPNTAIFYTKEGQIIKAGEPYTFEGSAHAYEDPIVAVEFSLDNGETWKRYDTEGAQAGVWVYWHFTFTPQEEGAYVLKVRSVTESGLVSETPATTMVNAVY